MSTETTETTESLPSGAIASQREQMSIGRPAVEMQPGGAMFQNARNARIQNSTFNIYARCDDCHGTMHPSHTPSPPNSSQLDEIPPSQLYRDRLQRKGLGIPLYTPGPNERLSDAYLKSGVMFGDVGIINPDGSFSYLFSVVHEATHPRNAGVQLPPDFVPFAASPNACETEERREFDGTAASHLGDSSVTRIDSGENLLETVLETSARQAAVLVLPEIVHTVRMLAMLPLQRYIRKHLLSWYTFVREVKGWDTKNGDLCVVYLTRKSSGYGIATVCNGAPDPTTRLVFSINLPQPDTVGGCKYRWTQRGCATVKAGPSTGNSQLVNQCLFVETINQKLSEKEWAAIEGSAISLLDRQEHHPDLSGQSDRQSQGQRGSFIPGSSGSIIAKTAGVPSTSPAMNYLDITVEQSTQYKIPMPSDILADLLLLGYPDASVVSVCTQDWGPYYTDSIEHISEFVQKVLSGNNFCDDDGLVYLLPKPQQLTSIAAKSLPQPAMKTLPHQTIYDTEPKTQTVTRTSSNSSSSPHQGTFTKGYFTPKKAHYPDAYSPTPGGYGFRPVKGETVRADTVVLLGNEDSSNSYARETAFDQGENLVIDGGFFGINASKAAADYVRIREESRRLMERDRDDHAIRRAELAQKQTELELARFNARESAQYRTAWPGQSSAQNMQYSAEPAVDADMGAAYVYNPSDNENA